MVTHLALANRPDVYAAAHAWSRAAT